MRTKPKRIIRDIGSQAAEVTRRCHDCGRFMKGTRQMYQYAECGLKSVTLLNVLVFECECGLKVPEIPAITGLHGLIALELLCKRTLLAGEEVRFLRKMTGLSQTELARIMGVDPTRPSKWERAGISKESDRFLRTLCLVAIGQQFVQGKNCEQLEAIAANEEFRNLDVREILKSIQDKKTPPRLVKVANDPTKGQPWVLSHSPEGAVLQ